MVDLKRYAHNKLEGFGIVVDKKLCRWQSSCMVLLVSSPYIVFGR